MRAVFASIFLSISSGCTPVDSSDEIERLEIRLSGWSSLDIVIDDVGNVIYTDSEPFPDGTTGRFKLTQGQLTEVRESLQTYREQSVLFSEKSAMEFIERTCPSGVPFTDEAGAFYARWVTANHDSHYLADFGCDHERMVDRNRQLRQIVEGLPIPIDW